MILVFTNNGKGASAANERDRNLSAYRAGEVEACEGIRIEGDHPNAAVVRKDYEAKGIAVLGGYKGVAAEFAKEELAEAPKRTRRAKGEV